jgi:hypothetical protein
MHRFFGDLRLKKSGKLTRFFCLSFRHALKTIQPFFRSLSNRYQDGSSGGLGEEVA